LGINFKALQVSPKTQLFKQILVKWASNTQPQKLSNIISRTFYSDSKTYKDSILEITMKNSIIN
jgi:hypothetical protein